MNESAGDGIVEAGCTGGVGIGFAIGSDERGRDDMAVRLSVVTEVDEEDIFCGGSTTVIGIRWRLGGAACEGTGVVVGSMMVIGTRRPVDGVTLGTPF